MISPAALERRRKKWRCRETGSAVGIAAIIADHQREPVRGYKKLPLKLPTVTHTDAIGYRTLGPLWNSP